MPTAGAGELVELEGVYDSVIKILGYGVAKIDGNGYHKHMRVADAPCLPEGVEHCHGAVPVAGDQLCGEVPATAVYGYMLMIPEGAG